MSELSPETLVIGAGSTGSSIAYHMKKRGMNATLVDMYGIAGGNTGKSSGLVRTHYSDETVARMSKYSLEILRNFSDIGYSGYTETGMIYAFQEADIESEKNNMEMLKGLGIGIGEMNVKDLSSFYSPVNCEDFDFISYEPRSGYADPVATSNSFTAKAREMGATVNINKKAVKIEKSGSKTRVYFSDGKNADFDSVVLATNIWTNKLLLNSGVDQNELMPIWATRHNVIYLRRPKSYTGIKPVLWDMAQLSYYKMEGESLTAIGSLDPERDKTQTDPEEEVFNEATDEYLEEYLGKISARLPDMKDATLVSAVSGKYDMTPDGEPIMDNLSHLDLGNVYLCAGLSGHGFKLSPAIGNMVADMVQGRNPKNCMFDWGKFNWKRFKDGKLIGMSHQNIGTLY